MESLKLILSIFVMALLVGGCGKLVPKIDITRIDLDLRRGVMPPDSIDRNAVRTLFLISGYGNPSDFSVKEYANKPSITIHYNAVDSVWPNMDDIECRFGGVSEKFGKELPKVHFPRLYGIISPFNQSVIIADTILFLGLNHYLGEDYPPYSHFQDYIAKRKIPQRIIPDAVEAIIRNAFPYKEDIDANTVLDRIVYEGAIVESVVRITGLSAQKVIGYTDDEFAWLRDNEQQIWKKLAERRILFSSDDVLASSLVNLSPATTAIGPNVPGQIGRYIGYRIVESYLKRNKATLEGLLHPAFYKRNDVLSVAGYVP